MQKVANFKQLKKLYVQIQRHYREVKNTSFEIKNKDS